MNARSTVLLGAVAVVVLGLGLYLGTADQEQRADISAEQAAFPGLAPRLSGAADITVSQDGKTVHLVREGDTWTLPDKGGYRAKDTSVHELLASLAELKLAEPRTSDPAEYARLGVADPPKDAKAAPKDGEAGAILVRVKDSGGTTLADLLVGHPRLAAHGATDGVYVRRPGEARAWLADGPMKADADTAQWLDAAIADIPAEKIQAVTVTRDGQTLAFARKDKALAMTAPADHPPLEQFKLDDIGRAFQALELDDVRPAPAPGKPEGQSVFTTSDGMTITATVSKDGENVWAEFAIAGDPKATANDKAAADALAAKLKGWAYRIGTWKEAAFVPTLDGLKAPPPAKPAAAPTPAPEAPAAQ
jgi:hypothetical protein